MATDNGANTVHSCLSALATQCGEALRIGETAALPPKRPYRRIVFCGMGGSALGGEFASSLAQQASGRCFSVVRGDTLPPFVQGDALCFCLSYSGNTGETLACAREAAARGCTVVTLSAGGALATLPAAATVTVPGGYQPRLAFFYLSLPLLVMMRRLELAPLADADCGELYAALARGEEPAAARDWALFLRRKTAVIWGGPHSVAARSWKNQINENAKQMAFCNELPEAGHNEITGFRHPAGAQGETALVLLRDEGETAAETRRWEAARAVLRADGALLREHWARGRSPLARQGRQIALGMWVSYELALLNGEDPAAIEPITRFKTLLRS